MVKLAFAASIAAVACNGAEPNTLPPAAIVADAAADTSAADASGSADDDALAEASFFCTPPAGATTADDAGGGCVPRPGIYGNGGDACTTGEYGMTCNDYLTTTTLPASLQCQAVAVPTAPGVTFYCCPCVPLATHSIRTYGLD